MGKTNGAFPSGGVNETRSCARYPSLCEFELAYQIRVALDRIRFALKVIEGTRDALTLLPEASLQLLDALDRLEWADRRFQDRFRADSAPPLHKVSQRGHGS